MVVPAPLPVVAIVGRPNVGKSTLFNRIVGSRQAVVHPTPGVTRDRNYGQAEYKGRPFFLIDTGGFEPATHDRLLIQMREQTMLAVDEADAIIFLADVVETDNPADDEIIKILRKSAKPIFVAVNKCDSPRREDEAWALSRFGFERLYPVSALHGRGILDLLDDLIEKLPEREAPEEESRATHIAIVGRQNAGKSTLLNRLIGEERVIANPIPGTTRDAIDTWFEREGQRYCLIDTAGIRRRGHIERGIEHLAVVSAVFAIKRCDVALLIIDAARGIHQQDTHIAGTIIEEHKPCVIVLNKWDVIEKDNETYGKFIKDVRDAFNFLPHAQIVTLSALTGQRCGKLWELIDFATAQSAKEIPTGELNRVIHAAVQKVTPPVYHGQVLKVKYATQVATHPPTFALFVNDPKHVHFSYHRYLLNRIREAFELSGTPIRVLYRRKSPPAGWEAYVEERRRRAGERRQARPSRPPRAPQTPKAAAIEDEEDFEFIGNEDLSPEESEGDEGPSRNGKPREALEKRQGKKPQIAREPLPRRQARSLAKKPPGRPPRPPSKRPNRPSRDRKE